MSSTINNHASPSVPACIPVGFSNLDAKRRAQVIIQYLEEKKKELQDAEETKRFKTWKSICGRRYDYHLMKQIYQEYLAYKNSLVDDDGLNRYQRMTLFLSRYDPRIDKTF
jgi:hypothetical protein